MKVEAKLKHYLLKALHDYSMLQAGDRVMVCVSGGKDSFSLLYLLDALRREGRLDCSLHAYTLDQSQPGWDDRALRAWMEQHDIDYCVETRNTYGVVKEKIPEGKSTCSLCSRLRRGNIYRYAREHGFKKIALGHHRDDVIETLLLSVCYNGQIKSMPPKLLTDNQQHIVVRPMVYCQERDIRTFAEAMAFPLIPCNLCGTQKNLARVRIKEVIRSLSAQNPKVPSNMLHALQSVQLSQLMDKTQWDFTSMDALLLEESISEASGDQDSF